MSKLKVCFMITNFDQGGAQKQCVALLNELQKNTTIELHAIYFYGGVNFPFLEQKNITLHHVVSGSLYDPRNILKISKILKRIKPDILFSWLHACDVYAFFARKSVSNCKWIMAERDSYYPVDLRYILRQYLGVKADMIICNSEQGGAYWRKNKAQNNIIKIISNILNVEEPENKLAIKGQPLVVYAGRLEIQKNVIILTKIFCKLSDKYPEGKFYIIGSGSLEGKIKQEIALSGKEKNVIMLPFITNIYDYYNRSDLFVNLSKHEGMPNTVIENIALGKLVVVSDINEHKDILGSNYPFYMKDLNDVNEGVDLIELALNASKEKGLLRYANSKIIKMKADIVANKYARLFKEVMNG